MTVMIYTVTCTKGYLSDEVGTRFSLHPWGENTIDYEGFDDGGLLYDLPNGFEVAEVMDNNMAIFDADGNICPLIDGGNKPVIVLGRESIVLERVGA